MTWLEVEIGISALTVASNTADGCDKHERPVGILSGAVAKSRASLRRVLQHYEQLRLVCHLKVVSTQAEIIE